MEAECAVMSEERARLSMEATGLQQEESRLRSESAHVEQLRLAVERERATLLDKMNLAESSGQEANRLNQSSLALQREGGEKMAAAERLQMGLAEQAEVVKRERRELEERESQLVSERLAFARECREHQENHLQSEFVHSQPTPILTSTRRMSNAFTAELDLSHSFPQPLRPSSSRQKHKEGDDNELSSQQQSSHQEEQSLREERELLATIQHQNSLMLTNHYNRPYLPRNEKLTS
ncbi:hypothetical protein GBAR_LOCUS26168 [Geodia barretti]|nr:hypothetical protein GBAR_LOCUS26168 [Geodia barretti]